MGGCGASGGEVARQFDNDVGATVKTTMAPDRMAAGDNAVGDEIHAVGVAVTAGASIAFIKVLPKPVFIKLLLLVIL